MKKFLRIIVFLFIALLLMLPVKADTNIKKYKYVINYYKDSVEDENLIDSVEKEDLCNSVIKIDSNYLVPEGYIYSDEAVSFILESNKEIDIVYKKKNNLNYCVNYFYDGIIYINNTDCFYNIEYGTKIDTFIKKEVEGYVFDYFEPITVLDIEENIMNVYYKSINKNTNISYEKSNENETIYKFIEVSVNILKNILELFNKQTL